MTDEKPQAAPEKPQGMRMELHVEWINGNVSVSAPPNPILAMIIISDAMEILAKEYAKAMQQEQSLIIQPGGVPVDKRIVEEAQGNKG